MTNRYYIQTSPDLALTLFQIWYDGYQTGYADADPLPSADFKPTPRFPTTYEAWAEYLKERKPDE